MTDTERLLAEQLTEVLHAGHIAWIRFREMGYEDAAQELLDYMIPARQLMHGLYGSFRPDEPYWNDPNN